MIQWAVYHPEAYGLMLLGTLLLSISVLGAYVDGRRSRSHRR